MEEERRVDIAEPNCERNGNATSAKSPGTRSAHPSVRPEPSRESRAEDERGALACAHAAAAGDAGALRRSSCECEAQMCQVTRARGRVKRSFVFATTLFTSL
eukprot:4789081-Pleurochrysis_carterae.AAC.1